MLIGNRRLIWSTRGALTATAFLLLFSCCDIGEAQTNPQANKTPPANEFIAPGDAPTWPEPYFRQRYYAKELRNSLCGQGLCRACVGLSSSR